MKIIYWIIGLCIWCIITGFTPLPQEFPLVCPISKSLNVVMDNPPAEFRFFIPPGTIRSVISTYYEQEAMCGVAARFRNYPSCTYPRMTKYAHYWNAPWDTVVQFSDLKARDCQIKNRGGTGQILNVANSNAESGWFFVKQIPYDRAVRKVVCTFFLDSTRYNTWRSTTVIPPSIILDPITSVSCTFIGEDDEEDTTTIIFIPPIKPNPFEPPATTTVPTTSTTSTTSTISTTTEETTYIASTTLPNQIIMFFNNQAPVTEVLADDGIIYIGFLQDGKWYITSIKVVEIP